MMSVWIKERAKSLKTNLKKNKNSKFKRLCILNTNTKEIIVISRFMCVFVDLTKTKNHIVESAF